jgi:hypothetical protein
MHDNNALNSDTDEGNSNSCYKGSTAITKENDRRMIFAAVINCSTDLGPGHATITRPCVFVSLFLTKPFDDKELHLDVGDVTG